MSGQFHALDLFTTSHLLVGSGSGKRKTHCPNYEETSVVQPAASPFIPSHSSQRVARLRAGCPKNRGSMPGRRKAHSSSPKRRDPLLDPSILIVKGYRGFSPRE
jgi:hypothetical protein